MKEFSGSEGQLLALVASQVIHRGSSQYGNCIVQCHNLVLVLVPLFGTVVAVVDSYTVARELRYIGTYYYLFILFYCIYFVLLLFCLLHKIVYNEFSVYLRNLRGIPMLN